MKHDKKFTDIHCHMLPGLDDGAETLEDALAMAETAVADGIDTIVATPHQLGNHSHNSADEIRVAVARFQQQLDRRRISLRVLPGADVRIEPDLVRRIRADKVLTLGDHRRHILLELPHDVYVPLDRVLSELRGANIVGILSHPERNRGILQQPNVLKHLVQLGCLMQVTAGSLLGKFGPDSQMLTENMLEQGLVHFVSTDAHNLSSRPPRLSRSFRRVADLTNFDTAVSLCRANPAQVAKGQDIEVRSLKFKLFAHASWLHYLPFSSSQKKKKNVA